MALHLSIENESRLPDGGPLAVTLVDGRGLDIGRDPHLDWTLPDPTRTISGRHCEVRFHDGCYWLHDVSANGTFVNGSDQPLQAPHRLRDGDRIEIGHYLIAVALDRDATAPRSTAVEPTSSRHQLDIWETTEQVAPASPAGGSTQRLFEVEPLYPDFLDWATDPLSPAPVLRKEPLGEEDKAWIPHVDAARRHSTPASSGPVVGAPSRAGSTPEIFSPTEVDRGEPRLVHKGVPGDSSNEHAASGSESCPSTKFALPSNEPPDPSVDQQFLRRFAEGAGIPEEVIAWRDPDEFAEFLGGLMRLITEDLKSLLAARAESRRLTRSTNQTTIQALDNNPLKFSPTAGDALRLMFGKPTSGYLDARRTFEASFKDLRVHQIKTYAAMQHALRMLVEDLDPQAVEEATPVDKGLGALTGSRKARLWDTFVTRWEAKTVPHDDGLVNAFMTYFAECYDRIDKKSW